MAGEYKEYNPAHCMAVYIPEAEYEEDSLRIPAIIAGEAVSHHGQACTLLVGIPLLPPGGSIVMGTWKDIEQSQPQLLTGLQQPTGDSDYLIRLSGFTLLTAKTREGILHGAHTLGQLLSMHVGQKIPALVISDQPAFPQRSLACDFTHGNPTAEHLVNLVALISSFKANRLHLLLQSDQPLSNAGNRGSATYDDALAIGQRCHDYGIMPVPSADLAGAVSAGRIRHGQACEAALDLLNAFDTDAIAVGGMNCPVAGDSRAVRGFIRSVLDNCQYEPRVYLDASAVCLLYADTPVPEQVVAQFTQASATDRNLDFISSANIAIAMHATSMTNSFVPALPCSMQQRISDTLCLAKSANAIEFGFFADNVLHGHLLANDIPEVITCICEAWREQSSPTASATAFAEFAFADKASDFLDLRKQLAEKFPAALREPGGTAIIRSAFGFPLSAQDWQKVIALDWQSIRQSMRTANHTLCTFKNRIQSNSTIIEYADIGVAAMQFLDAKQQLLPLARCHYEAARQGRSGSLRMAATALANLREMHKVFLWRMQEVFAATGSCAEELEAMGGFGSLLSNLHDKLNNLEDTAQAAELPEPGKIGFPDVFGSGAGGR